MKGAAATGLTAGGLGATSGNVAAQKVKNLNVGDVAVSDGLLSIQIQNVNVLRNVRDNVQDVVVTIIGGDVRVLEDAVIDVDVLFEESLIRIDVQNVDGGVLNDALNNNNVLVNVAILSGTDTLLAAGDTIA